jgi:hypothetical protein
MNNGYNVTQFYDGDRNPALSEQYIGGAQDNGTQRFTGSIVLAKFLLE